jgi:hypothetical protein
VAYIDSNSDDQPVGSEVVGGIDRRTYGKDDIMCIILYKFSIIVYLNKLPSSVVMNVREIRGCVEVQAAR